ncbi:MAG: HAMP domain-containing histidine kinase [Prevotella sp.]|nr:HAMP domain-containing histidine kinase [Candidatus Equicola faecalis]MDO4820309.1 HAMP domain-containing sensor histidine kinase [Prevotella sp.]
MQWTDRIRQVKILLVIVSVIIVAASLVVSHYLVSDLERQEHQNMEVWAEAMRTLSIADENTDLGLALKVLEGNNTIPIVVKDRDGNIIDHRNIADTTKMVRVSRKSDFIRISLDTEILADSTASSGDYIDVCYDDSIMLKRLEFYPYVQLGVVLIFVIVAIFALLTSKKAEQNKVWVGLSKETAHQLGTPISSLMAWIEVLCENYPDDDLLPEMEKDVKRLQLIAERFSKIGSVPESKETSLTEVLNHVIDYMDRRTSSKVQIVKDFPTEDAIVRINSSLFEWVIENLCKNAVDAMEGSGVIRLHYEQANGITLLDVSDNGKGIRKKNVQNVFKPGFTTKSRGWGLGLSLAKRIVEEYHGGRIYVKSSEVGKGTTFRIELPS